MTIKNAAAEPGRPVAEEWSAAAVISITADGSGSKLATVRADDEKLRGAGTEVTSDRESHMASSAPRFSLCCSAAI